MLIVTKGKSSLDIYSQEISKRMNIDTFIINSPDSFKNGYNFLRSVRSTNVSFFHLPHQQFARYINFLNKPCILTVHDLTLQFPLLYKLNNRMKLYIKFDKMGIKKADHIIAISQNTKNDLISKIGISEEKITTIYQGIDHNIYKPQKKDNLYEFDYLLYVGSEQPRKNLESLLKAFYILKKEFKDLKLIKIGEPGLSEDRRNVLKIIKKYNLEDDIIFTGYIPEIELPHYYSNAKCFVFPSLYEGFGFPVIEAMACGCPVITSNVSSLPEIAGNAAVFVEPRDISSLVNSIRMICTDNIMRDRMIEKGLIQSKKYSWDLTAKETMNVYKEFIDLV